VCTALLSDDTYADNLLVVGSSSGGGLALSLAMSLRDGGTREPKAIGLLCPWLDLSLDIDGTRGARRTDPVLSVGILSNAARCYIADGNPQDPLISPIYGELGGLPPVVIVSASADHCAADAARLENRALEAGVKIYHKRIDGLWHDGLALSTWLTTARDGLDWTCLTLRRARDDSPVGPS